MIRLILLVLFNSAMSSDQFGGGVYYIYPGDSYSIDCDYHQGMVGTSIDTLCEACIVEGPAQFNDDKQCITPNSVKEVFITLSNHIDDVASICNNISKPIIIITVTLIDLNDKTIYATRNATLKFKPCLGYASIPQGVDGLCNNYRNETVYNQCYWDIKYTKCLNSDKNQGSLCSIRSSIAPDIGYCITPYPPDSPTTLIMGRCPLVINNLTYVTVLQLNDIDSFCQVQNQVYYGNRTNTLCGSCSNNTGIPINSLFFECSCPPSLNGLSSLPVILLVLLEILPVTVTIVAIIVLSIDLTDGATTGYVFACQMISLSIPGYYYPAYGYTSNTDFGMHQYNIDYWYLQWFALFPFSIWNLDFITPLGYALPICLTSTALGAISFWYVIAIYPLVLSLGLYGWIVMYERGYKVIVCVTRPLHCLLARFWQVLDIKPSLVHSIAGIYTLTFTQFAVTSVKLLYPTTWKSVTNDTIWGVAFFYDGSVAYFGRSHGIYASLAIVIFIIFLMIPTLHLVLYPFKFYQIFLELCKLRSEFLVALSDAFSGSFKNGTDNTWDYRYYAGLYLFLRIAFLCVFYAPMKQSNMYIKMGIGLFNSYAASIAIFRPYKRNIHNFLTIIILLCLIVNFTGDLVPIAILLISHALCLLVALYCIYKVIRKCCHCCCKYMRRSTVNEHQFYDLPADRTMNPQNYKERHFQNSWLNPKPIAHNIASDEQPETATTCMSTGDISYGTVN